MPVTEGASYGYKECAVAIRARFNTQISYNLVIGAQCCGGVLQMVPSRILQRFGWACMFLLSPCDVVAAAPAMPTSLQEMTEIHGQGGPTGCHVCQLQHM